MENMIYLNCLLSIMPNEFMYDLVAELITDGNGKLSKYKSRNSGLIVYICQVNGPVVRGCLTFEAKNNVGYTEAIMQVVFADNYSAVSQNAIQCAHWTHPQITIFTCFASLKATEMFDDDGLPYVLDHLVFTGSEKYPYKGVLDMIADRCLSVTGSDTDGDHTRYYVETAGDEGFLKILPIYLDHLLFPTLNDSAFTTKVHHINGEGEDAGDIYLNMQEVENYDHAPCYRAVVHALYPGHCGYKYEPYGLTKNLRESTTNEKVRAYHKEYYRPENLCCIIVGQVDPEKVFEALIPVEERILQEGERGEFVRPWQTPVPPLTESVTHEVLCPTDEEEFGMLYVAWRGPEADDAITSTALKILLDYLTETSVAPLNREFVEIDDPLCSEVNGYVMEKSVVDIGLNFSNVPKERLKELEEKVFIILRNIADGKEEIDMQRLTTLIKKRKLYILSRMENTNYWEDYMSSCLVEDFLYGHTLEDLENRVKKIPGIEKLLEADVQFWVTLLRTYMVDGNHVVLLGVPSKELYDQMSKAEKERVKEQKERLGPDGLKEKAEVLKKAIEANDIPPPKEMISSITVPSVKSITFHPLKRTCNVHGVEGDDVPFAINNMPCRFQVDCVQTPFVRLCVLIDTSHLSIESRMYLPLLIELFYECAVERNGEIVPYEDVIKQIAEDTMSKDAGLGLQYKRFFCSHYSQAVCLRLKVEEDKYERSVQWVREILYQLCIEPSQIKSTINKMLMDVPTIKQSGSDVVKSMMENLCFTPESNHWTASVFRQHVFLNNLQKQLEENPDEVVAKLNEIREEMGKPDKMMVHLALNLDSMKEKLVPEEVWLKEFLPSSISPGFMDSNLKKCSEYIQPIASDCTKGLIAGISSVESTHILQSAVCNIENISDYASLLVLFEYFTKLDRMICHPIHGCRYEIGFKIYVNRDTGLIYLDLPDAINPVKAYKAAVDAVDSLLNGNSNWDTEFLESARTKLISRLIEGVRTVDNVVDESLQAYCRDPKSDVYKELNELLEKASVITTADMERVGVQYIKPLFDPELSRCAITCNPTKVNEIKEEFEKLSRELTIVPSLEENFMCEY